VVVDSEWVARPDVAYFRGVAVALCCARAILCFQQQKKGAVKVQLQQAFAICRR